MMFSTLPLLLLPFTFVLLPLPAHAQTSRATNTSICDYYTPLLLKTNNATTQHTLLALLVNTAVIGNYSPVNVGITVPGILAKGTYNGTAVNLLPFFDGGLASTNNNNGAGVAKNFLDDGGAAPLLLNMPANGTSSNQYTLLTHLYAYFGFLLGCSELGTAGFGAYTGDSSMYNVHRFMALDAFQLGYFIQQVGLSAASFGVESQDVAAVGTALQRLFGERCAGATEVIKGQGAANQAICVAPNCPLASPANCSAYEATVQPSVVNGTTSANSSATTGGSTGTAVGSGTATGSATANNNAASASSKSGSTATHVAMAVRIGPAIAIVGAAAVAFAL